MLGPELVDQVVKDFKGFKYKNSKLFKTVEPGSGAVDNTKHFKNTPHAQVRITGKTSDEAEPMLGEQRLVVKVFIRDHSGGPDGTKQQSSSGLRGFYTQIAKYLNDNYPYKAGGVYGAAMSIEDISQETPEGDGLWSFEATYRVLIG